MSYDAVADLGHFTRLNKAVEEAKLEVPIAATYALGEAGEAHKRLTGHVLGKIVLRVH